MAKDPSYSKLSPDCVYKHSASFYICTYKTRIYDGMGFNNSLREDTQKINSFISGRTTMRGGGLNTLNYKENPTSFIKGKNGRTKPDIYERLWARRVPSNISGSTNKKQLFLLCVSAPRKRLYLVK